MDSLARKTMIRMLRLVRDLARDDDDQEIYPVVDELLVSLGYPELPGDEH